MHCWLVPSDTGSIWQFSKVLCVNRCIDSDIRITPVYSGLNGAGVYSVALTECVDTVTYYEILIVFRSREGRKGLPQCAVFHQAYLALHL